MLLSAGLRCVLCLRGLPLCALSAGGSRLWFSSAQPSGFRAGGRDICPDPSLDNGYGRLSLVANTNWTSLMSGTPQLGVSTDEVRAHDNILPE